MAAGASEALRAKLRQGSARWANLPQSARAPLLELDMAERLALALHGETRESALGNERCSPLGLCLLLGTTAAVQRNFKEKVAEYEQRLEHRYGVRLPVESRSTPPPGPLLGQVRRARAVFYFLTSRGEQVAAAVRRRQRLEAIPPEDLRWLLHAARARRAAEAPEPS